MSEGPLVRMLGRVDYERIEPAMQMFTRSRGADTRDEIWVVEHPPVFTLGRAAGTAHVHDAGAIPVIRTERGGQVTYHGPGQAVAYPLVDLRRGGWKLRDFVAALETSTIALLAAYAVDAERHDGAPGVYLRHCNGSAGAKIASIGIRVVNGCSYHGVALNVAMDLEPFSRIDPCGYPGLAVVDMRSCIGTVPAFDEVASRFAETLATTLSRSPSFSRSRSVPSGVVPAAHSQ